MKLNSVSSLQPISWQEVANIHPFAPLDTAKGYREMLHSLEQYLCKLTDFAACSLQPASGAQGEYFTSALVVTFSVKRTPVAEL